MNDVNDIVKMDFVKTYGTCLFWILGAGCLFFFLGYLIGYNVAPTFGADYFTYSIKAEYALNGGFLGASVGMLGALVISGAVIKSKKYPRTSWPR